MLTSCGNSKTVYQDDYDAEAAVAYAHKYAEVRNMEYAEFNVNCTNFISQCFVAGGLEMDEGPAPDKKTRIKYGDSTSKWYFASESFFPERPPNYSVGLPFVNTKAFIEYWQEERGFEIKKYPNSFEGRDKLIEEARLGDVFLFYDYEGDISHLGLITKFENNDALFSSNTSNRLDFSVCNINEEIYPELGIIYVN